jgi:hypothetical protein
MSWKETLGYKKLQKCFSIETNLLMNVKSIHSRIITILLASCEFLTREERKFSRMSQKWIILTIDSELVIARRYGNAYMIIIHLVFFSLVSIVPYENDIIQRDLSSSRPRYRYPIIFGILAFIAAIHNFRVVCFIRCLNIWNAIEVQLCHFEVSGKINWIVWCDIITEQRKLFTNENAIVLFIHRIIFIHMWIRCSWLYEVHDSLSIKLRIAK